MIKGAMKVVSGRHSGHEVAWRGPLSTRTSARQDWVARSMRTSRSSLVAGVGSSQCWPDSWGKVPGCRGREKIGLQYPGHRVIKETSTQNAERRIANGCPTESELGTPDDESVWEYWYRYDAVIQEKAKNQNRSSVGRCLGEQGVAEDRAKRRGNPEMVTHTDVASPHLHQASPAGNEKKIPETSAQTPVTWWEAFCPTR